MKYPSAVFFWTDRRLFLVKKNSLILISELVYASSAALISCFQSSSYGWLKSISLQGLLLNVVRVSVPLTCYCINTKVFLVFFIERSKVFFYKKSNHFEADVCVCCRFTVSRISIDFVMAQLKESGILVIYVKITKTLTYLCIVTRNHQHYNFQLLWGWSLQTWM